VVRVVKLDVVEVSEGADEDVVDIASVVVAIDVRADRVIDTDDVAEDVLAECDVDVDVVLVMASVLVVVAEACVVDGLSQDNGVPLVSRIVHCSHTPVFALSRTLPLWSCKFSFL
jgi:hypothetical protein